jgi:low affinity Fe/Cu permease
MDKIMFRRTMTRLGKLTGHPIAFVLTGLYALCWWLISPATLEWHAIATIATLFMTVLIQRATHRDTQALHAKLDELLKANHGAKNSLTKIDSQEPEDIEQHRKNTSTQ